MNKHSTSKAIRESFDETYAFHVEKNGYEHALEFVVATKKAALICKPRDTDQAESEFFDYLDEIIAETEVAIYSQEWGLDLNIEAEPAPECAHA